MGRYHYPRHVLHVHEHPRAGYQNGVLCRFWGLVVGAPEERREPSEQRCAYARRCSEGVAAPLGCVIRGHSIKVVISLLSDVFDHFLRAMASIHFCRPKCVYIHLQWSLFVALV